MLRKLVSFLKIVIFFLFLALFTIFVSNNLEFVHLNLSPFDYVVEARVFLLILISFAVGVILTACIGYVGSMFNFKIFFLTKKSRILERQLRNIRKKYGDLETKNALLKARENENLKQLKLNGKLNTELKNENKNEQN